MSLSNYGMNSKIGPTAPPPTAVIIARSSTIAYDALVIGLTLYKSLLLKKTSNRLNLKAPIVTLLLRDGEFNVLIPGLY